jgi:hypothetical protein
MRYVLPILALAACAQPRPYPEPKQPRTMVGRVAMIPARFHDVAWWSVENASLLQWAEGLGPPPACLAEIRAGLDGYVQASALDSPPALHVFQGRFDRDQVEACLPQVAQNVGLTLSIVRDGAITHVSEENGSLYLGWSANGDVVYHDDRHVVEEVLAGKTSVRDNAEVMALVAHADTSQPLWSVSSRDLGTPLFGVPARGWIIAGKMAPGSPLPITFVFSAPQEAQQVIALLRSMASDERFSPALRATIGASQPTAKGSDVTLDLMVFIAAMSKDPALMAEIQGLVDELQP